MPTGLWFTSGLERCPRGALLSTGEKDVLVTSPEFTLLQLAGPPYSTSLQTIRLASLMMELAGTYRRSPTSYGRPRLTSYNNLSRFIETVPHARGRELYCRALHYEMDMSLSPMETAIALLLTLPVRLGGFGLPKPILNVRLRGTELRTDTSSQREILPDLYWPEQEVVLEYDSREHHGETGGVLANDEKLAHDAGRANSLVAAGRHVVTVRRRQATNLGRFDLVARQVAALLGKRLAMPSVEELERRAELHALLIRN